MQFGILGPLEVHDGARRIEVSAPKQRALLILLLIETDRIVSPDVVLDRLWPDRAPSAGLKTVRFHVSKLRSALEPEVSGGGFKVVETQGAGYTIVSDQHEIDSRLFERRAAEGHRELEARPDRAQRLLTEALDLWRGDALQDVAYDEFAADERRRLEALHVSAREDRIQAELKLGRSTDLVAELEILVAEHPLRERPTELLMQSLYASGRSADAIAAGQGLRNRLGEIGLDAPPSLTTLEDQVLAHDATLAPAAQTSTLEPGPTHLPRRLSSFVGRRIEMKEIETELQAARLVVLVGPPGNGKTRLAIEAATAAGMDDPSEPIWVDLTDADADLVPQAIVTALGVRAPLGADATQLVLGHLRDREGLMVLDNCEHVLGATARLVIAILEACPAITILVTSREVLGVPGEHVWPVPPFTLPPEESLPTEELREIDSVRLFIDRAQEAHSSFVLDDDNKDAVASICRRLDGLPLAIELAASATEALSTSQIAERLTRRFAEVPAVRRHGARQATMEEAIRWSYDQLDQTDKAIFNRLSVFAGGFTMAAAEEVAGWDDVDRSDVFDAILRLVHKSLLVPTHRRGDRVRYRMLTVLRQFGQRELREKGGDADVDWRHASFFADLAESIAPFLEGPKASQGRDVADAELDNLRLAIDSSLGADDTETATRLAGALTWYWYWRSYISEGYRYGTRILAATPEDAANPELAQVFYAVGIFETITGRYAAGTQAFQKARTMAQDLGMDALEAATLTGLGVNARDQGNLAASLEYLELAEGINRRLGDTARLALTLRFVGVVNFMLGHRQKAEDALDESYELFEQIGHRGGMGWALEGKARLSFRFDDEPNYELAERAASLYKEVRDRRNQAWLLVRTGGARLRAGALGAARIEIDRASELFAELGDNRGTAYATLNSGLLALVEDDLDRAGSELRRSLALFEEIGDTGGASAAQGSLCQLAVLHDDGKAAVEHCRAWLDIPTKDRYVWSILDVLEGLDNALTDRFGGNELVASALAGYREALQRGDPESAAAIAFDDLPDAIVTAIS